MLHVGYVCERKSSVNYSKYNHMPSYWDLWKGNCIYDFFFKGKVCIFFICFHVMRLDYFFKGSVVVFMASEG